jgi:hypothetical protein
VGAIVIRPSGTEGLPASITEGDAFVAVLSTLTQAQAVDTAGLVSQGCGNGVTCDVDTQPPGCTAEQVRCRVRSR